MFCKEWSAYFQLTLILRVFISSVQIYILGRPLNCNFCSLNTVIFVFKNVVHPLSTHLELPNALSEKNSQFAWGKVTHEMAGRCPLCHLLNLGPVIHYLLDFVCREAIFLNQCFVQFSSSSAGSLVHIVQFTIMEFSQI